MSIEYSIIIPCFNEGQSIQEVVTNLKAFLSQQFKASYEIIVVDDCSTDNTRKYLKLSKASGSFAIPLTAVTARPSRPVSARPRVSLSPPLTVMASTILPTWCICAKKYTQRTGPW